MVRQVQDLEHHTEILEVDKIVASNGATLEKRKELFEEELLLLGSKQPHALAYTFCVCHNYDVKEYLLAVCLKTKQDQGMSKYLSSMKHLDEL